MADSGWIKLYRTLLDDDVWTDCTPVQKVVMITLLLMANHKERKWMWRGKKFVAKPGQFVTSLESIKTRAGKGVSIRAIRTTIDKLKFGGFLTSESTNSGRLITIVNWAKYQGLLETVTNKTAGNRQATDKQSVRQLTTNKNVRSKEVKHLSPADAEPSVDYAGVIKYLNDQSGKRFRNTENNRKLIKARVREGFTRHDIAQAINNVVKGWKGTEMEQYIRPSTIFRASKFEGYVNSVPHAKTEAIVQPIPEPEKFSARDYAVHAYQGGQNVDEIIKMAKLDQAPVTADEIRSVIAEYQKELEADNGD